MNEPHVALSKPLYSGRQIPELSSAIAHVLANYDTSRRFRSGVLHFLHKSLPQRSSQKVIDRGSRAHLERAETRLFVSLALCAFCESVDRRSVTMAFVVQHFRLCLLAVRRVVCMHIENAPGLRALAALFFDVDAWVASTMAVPAPRLEDSSSIELSIVTPRNGKWSMTHFCKTTLDLLRPHCNLSPFASMICALHVAMSRGLTLGDALVKLGVTPSVVEQLRASLTVRRRLRKTRVREVLQSATHLDKVILQIALRALQRAQRYMKTRLPSSTHPRPMRALNDHAQFLLCTVCCTSRSAVGGNGARGASRCLYDFDSGTVTCGRKGNNAQLCSCTALLQINLSETVLHVEGQGFVARCSMCACFYRYTTASWSKGFLSCEACKYVVADEQPLLPACERCGRPFTTPIQLTPHASGDVFLRTRRCAHCT